MSDANVRPMLLLTAPDEALPFDTYLNEILHSEGWCLHVHCSATDGFAADDLSDYALVVASRGATRHLDLSEVERYVRGGGRLICMRPPREWGAMLGLEPRMAETYAVVRDGYLRVRDAHRWLAEFPAPDLQVHGETDAYEVGSGEALAWLAGQRGLVTPFAAVASAGVGDGAAVLFAFDLTECIVLHHQGRIANASNGPDPDANRDGKFTADDLFDGMRDYELRHVPQADVLQELLTRAIRGLTADMMPLPRLWRFPDAAPGMVLVDGDGDHMCPEDMRATVEICERHDAKFTFFLMDEELQAFDPQEIRDIRARGHAFGPHPRVPLRPTVAEWRREVTRITEDLRRRLGFDPESIRMHSCVLPGWDEAPRTLADLGLAMETSFLQGYRYQSGFLNGSALPARFIDRNGKILECWEQSTTLGDDTMVTTKTMLPVKSEQECIDLSLELMRELAGRYHGVFHPYFHPINVGGHGRLPTERWLDTVLAEAGRLGMPAPSCDRWLSFTRARRAARIDGIQWDRDAGALHFRLTGALPAEGLTVLVPAASSVEVGGDECALSEVTGQSAFTADLPKSAELSVDVTCR
jgi:hypothetical protein